MMKVILDTNVFVSGVFFAGPPFKILQAWRDGKIELVVSQEILEEYSRVGEVLAEDHPGIDLKPILQYLVQNVIIVQTIPLSESVCDDPDDDKLIACALASGIKIIVSGDKHLLKVNGYHDVETIKPKEFLEKYL